MTLAEKLKNGEWKHTDDEARIEDLIAQNSNLGEDLVQYALRFISEKQLSGEFADALEEIQKLELSSEPEPE